MIIELHGGQFENKGAYKMLLTTMDELGKRIPDARFVVDASVGSQEQRDSVGLKTLVAKRGWMGSRGFRLRFALQALIGRIPASRSLDASVKRILLSQTDAIVDLAGFAYSDQWGPRPVADFARVAAYYQHRRKPVIMLPQALGPFENQISRNGFSQLAATTTVIYARDRQSLKHARQSATKEADIRICPDMTLPVAASFSDSAPDRPLIFIPNMRVVDKGGVDVNTYTDLLANTIERMQDQGTVKILVHDSQGQDQKIADLLSQRLGKSIAIINENDPLALKKEIARASLVVASRYHALVASLSCGVPSIAIGWSHKYAELMKEFNCTECIFDASSSVDEVVKQARLMSEDSRNRELRASLRESAKQKFLVVSTMWDDVASMLHDNP